MRTAKALCILVCFAVAACHVERTRQPDLNGSDHEDAKYAETAGPHFATLCIAEADWPRLLSVMRKFGAENGLEMHGGSENSDLDGRPIVNAFLAQGYNFYLGDDFDIWFVSSPYDTQLLDVNGIVKRKPIKPKQLALAKKLLNEVTTFSRRPERRNSDDTCS